MGIFMQERAHLLAISPQQLLHGSRDPQTLYLQPQGPRNLENFLVSRADSGARLDHEAADGAVEYGVGVVAALGQHQEVLACARRDVAVQLQVQVALPKRARAPSVIDQRWRLSRHARGTPRSKEGHGNLTIWQPRRCQRDNDNS